MKLKIKKQTISQLADRELLLIEAGAVVNTAWRDCTYINCRETVLIKK